MNHRKGTACVRRFACAAYIFFAMFTGRAGEMQLLTTIKGCATTEQGKSSDTRGIPPHLDPQITYTNGVIRYYRAIKHQCCRKVTVSKQVKDRTITLLENWTGQGCRCICFSEIEAVISKVTAGTYQVVVYEGGTAPQSDEILPQNLVKTGAVTVP